MASSIQITGKQPSARAAVILAAVDYADLIATDDLYNTGGEEYAALTAALEGLTWEDMPVLVGSYYFKINTTTKKIQAFTDAVCATEVTADTDMAAYTKVPILVVGE
jgi:hypothetical protein